MDPRLASARLYLVTGRSTPERLRACLDGGVDLVQLRLKEAPDEEILREADWMAPLCHAAGVPFLLNDRPDLVVAAQADGVHVGQDDDPLEVAHAAVAGGVVGLSTHTPPQLAAALALHAARADGSPGSLTGPVAFALHAASVPGELRRAGLGEAAGPPVLAPPAAPDYVAVGPVHATPTKPGRAAVGLEYVRHAAAHVPADLPWFAIGGIDTATVAAVAEAGARRVVVVRALSEAADPAAAAAALLAELPPVVAA